MATPSPPLSPEAPAALPEGMTERQQIAFLLTLSAADGPVDPCIAYLRGECPEGHALTVGTTEHDDYMCDVCQWNGIAAGAKIYQCAEGCDFDVCTSCYKKGQAAANQKRLLEEAAGGDSGGEGGAAGAGGARAGARAEAKAGSAKAGAKAAASSRKTSHEGGAGKAKGKGKGGGRADKTSTTAGSKSARGRSLSAVVSAAVRGSKGSSSGSGKRRWDAAEDGVLVEAICVCVDADRDRRWRMIAETVNTAALILGGAAGAKGAMRGKAGGGGGAVAVGRSKKECHQRWKRIRPNWLT